MLQPAPQEIAQTTCRFVGEQIAVFEPQHFDVVCYTAKDHENTRTALFLEHRDTILCLLPIEELLMGS